MPSGAKRSDARPISPGVRGALEIIEGSPTEGRGFGVGGNAETLPGNFWMTSEDLSTITSRCAAHSRNL